MQALIWYPEQELYKSLGVRLKVTSTDYAKALNSLLTEGGYSGTELSAAEATEVKMIMQLPPIDKLDDALNQLELC